MCHVYVLCNAAPAQTAVFGHIFVEPSRPLAPLQLVLINAGESVKVFEACGVLLLHYSPPKMMSVTVQAGKDPHLAANREYFDKEARKYDDRPVAIKLAHEVGKFVISKFTFDEDKTVLLDFACGTGALFLAA